MANAPKSNQKSWLTAAKRTLARRNPGLTWDDFARLAGIDPRAFKTYRLPEDSSNYRTMPALAQSAIQSLLSKCASTEQPSDVSLQVPSGSDQTFSSVLIPSLAALVVRQAQLSLIEGRMVAGVDRSRGCPVGLSPEDRRAMSLVSRACLVNGLSDRAAEIHDLLACCTKPLGDWLPISEVTEHGLATIALINLEDGMPTLEAEVISVGFSGITATLEEQLFAKFMELIGRYPQDTGNAYYTTIREFVVRHPICTPEDLKQLGKELPSTIWIAIQQQFYESVPESWAIRDQIPICDYCGNAMSQGKAGLVCRTTACSRAKPASSTRALPKADLLRVSRGIRQYWVEPGVDELRLYDAITNAGLSATLYPFRDRVDIGCGDVGIDLKTYASPETLGLRFKRSVGGLAYFAEKWVVVPDWQIAAVPSYLDRLRNSAGRPDLKYLSLSDALAKLKHWGTPHA